MMTREIKRRVGIMLFVLGIIPVLISAYRTETHSNSAKSEIVGGYDVTSED